jgi:uracil-DNA glycosylase family 4
MPPERLRVPGVGRPGAALLFLAEAPGRLGAGRTGIPFRGDRSGELFWSLIAELGIDDFYVTNAVKCNPLDARGCNRTPTAGERAACRAHWQAEVAAVRPRWLVPLGETACREVAGRPLRECVNRCVETEHGPAWALYHPAFVARHSYPVERYRDDWRTLLAAAGLAAGGSPHPPAQGASCARRPPSFAGPRRVGRSG